MPLHIYYDPLDVACKNLIGGVRQEAQLVFNIFSLKSSKIKDICITPTREECGKEEKTAYLHLWRDGEKKESFLMQNTEYGWTISLKIKEIGLYFYNFYIENEGFVSCGYLEKGILTNHDEPFLLTVFSKDYQTPDWFKGGVMYQIFPDRFAKKGSMPDIDGRVLRKDWGGFPSYKPNENGKVLKFLGEFFKVVGRDNLFISTKLFTVVLLSFAILYKLSPFFTIYIVSLVLFGSFSCCPILNAVVVKLFILINSLTVVS
mgnify:CR=1 FL=1